MHCVVHNNKSRLGYCVSDMEAHDIVSSARLLNGNDERFKGMKYVGYQSSRLGEGVLQGVHR